MPGFSSVRWASAHARILGRAVALAGAASCGVAGGPAVPAVESDLPVTHPSRSGHAVVLASTAACFSRFGFLHVFRTGLSQLDLEGVFLLDDVAMTPGSILGVGARPVGLTHRRLLEAVRMPAPLVVVYTSDRVLRMAITVPITAAGAEHLAAWLVAQ